MLPPPPSQTLEKVRRVMSRVAGDDVEEFELGNIPVVSENFAPHPRPETLRKYDLAMAYLGGERTAADLPLSGIKEARPPRGSPAIRPSVGKNMPPQAHALSALLPEVAGGALLVAEPDGSMSFDVDFHDDVFRELSCRIRVHGERVRAVFRATDVNTKRLIEGELGRLRAQLEGRGLRVDSMEVELVEPS